MSATTESPLLKIINWAIPRSLSSVFLRSLMTNSNVKVLYEPYIVPYYFGKDRLSNRYDLDVKNDTSGSFNKWICQTFDDVKATLDGDFPGKEAIFVKEMAFYVWQHANNLALLPEGYIHAFQIRDPRKAIPSLYKMTLNASRIGENYFDPKQVGFKELRQLYDHVQTVLRQQPIVIDGDDLARYPESMIKQYCQKTGLRYLDTMVDWSKCPIQDTSVFEGWESWVQNVFSSTHFIPPSSEKPVLEDSLPQIVQQCINDALPHYEHMYANRILP